MLQQDGSFGGKHVLRLEDIACMAMPHCPQTLPKNVIWDTQCPA